MTYTQLAIAIRYSGRTLKLLLRSLMPASLIRFLSIRTFRVALLTQDLDDVNDMHLELYVHEPDLKTISRAL